MSIESLDAAPFFFFFLLVQDVHVVTEDDHWEHDEDDGPLMMGTRGDGRCAAVRRGVRGATAGGMRGAAATLGGVRAAAAAACRGGGRGVHQVVLLVLVEEEEEEEEIYPNCHNICFTTDNYHLEDLATLSHLPTPLDCISLRTLNLRLN